LSYLDQKQVPGAPAWNPLSWPLWRWGMGYSGLEFLCARDISTESFQASQDIFIVNHVYAPFIRPRELATLSTRGGMDWTLGEWWGEIFG
jgi:hypothetical protein